MNDETVANIASKAWSRFLDDRDPAADHDFFAHGGHSLLLLRMAAWIKADSGRDLVLAEFLRSPTFAGLMRCLSHDSDSDIPTQQFGTGGRVILCIPGAYGRAIAFDRLAHAINEQLSDSVRLRCYELWNAVERLGPDAAIDALTDRLDRDLRRTDVVGIAGYSLGGLFPFVRDFSAIHQHAHLWLIDAYRAVAPRSHAARLAAGLRNAVCYPRLLPGGSVVTVRSQAAKLGRWVRTTSNTQASHPKSWRMQELLGRSIACAWRGPATLIRPRRRVLWTPYYDPASLNGLRDVLPSETRLAWVGASHETMLTTGVGHLADAIVEDIGRSRV